MTSPLHSKSVQTPAPRDIRDLTARELGALGITQMAYVKSVIVDGETAFAIFAADGTPMALTENREVALAAILQHEMVPAPVH